VDSEVGRGSSFCFTFPLQHGAGEQLAENGAGNAGATPIQVTGLTARVLILLEDPEDAEQAARVGLAAGLDCRACTSVEDLLAQQQKFAPDAYVVSVAQLQANDSLLARIRADSVSKLLVYSPEHGLTAPSLLDSAELLVPSLRALVAPGSKVLVVEDDDKYRGILEFDLQQSGYQVLTASNGRDALPYIRERTVAAVVLDLVMPGMDGLAVLERLAKNGGVEIPILVYTAMDDPSVALAAKDLGATEVFRKDAGGQVVYTAVAARVRRALSQVLAARGRAKQVRERLRPREDA
jgi:DNA-binding response OmpR family regulator